MPRTTHLALAIAFCTAPAALAGDCSPHWNQSIGQPGMAGGGDTAVYALTAINAGPLAGLYAGGEFSSAGGTGANHVAKWNGSSWSPLSSGTNGYAFASIAWDDGSGDGVALYVGGAFTTAGGVTVNHIAKWDGSSWSALAGGVNGVVADMCIFDDGTGPALFICGDFTTAGGASANRIAKWDGTSWSSIGSGANGYVYAIEAHDDGTGGGEQLYIGGTFTSVGGNAADRIARWTGATWQEVGGGMSNNVYDLESASLSGGPATLYAGGLFIQAGGNSRHRMAQWDGTSWNDMDGGMDWWVWNLFTFDDGAGTQLYAGGDFVDAGDGPASRIARWDGTSWSPLTSGANGIVTAMTTYDEGAGDGPALIIGGLFSSAGGTSAGGITKWQGCIERGACCINGSAIQAYEFECATVGGTFQGVGVPSGQAKCPATCAADGNGDGIVDVIDLLALLGAWGVCD